MRFDPFSRTVTGALAVGALLIGSGCGGGGSSGGASRPAPNSRLGNPPTIQKLETPLGVVGKRGSGGAVFISLNIRDREFNPSTIQVEYGWDHKTANGAPGTDGVITGSDGDPTDEDEYYPCTEILGLGDGSTALDSARGKGADHLFVWDSVTDLPADRFVTQDYNYTDQGRPILGSAGEPEFGNQPGMRIRMRASDSPDGGLEAGGGDRWGPWTYTKAFDLNNNSQPAVTIDATGIFGVNPNADGGVAATEDVILNLRVIDPDSGLGIGVDEVAIAVDYAFVPQGTNLADPNEVDALDWQEATTTAGTADTGLVSSPTPGTSTQYSWDSIADIGTQTGDYILRVTPFDSKSEHGPTVMQQGSFPIDNYTVFTDSGAALSAPRLGHQATRLPDDRVLVTGGRTTASGNSVSTAELFLPGIGQTTFGAVAATSPMNTARSFHGQTLLLNDKVLVVGGYNAANNAVLNTLEVYDPTANTWTTLNATLPVGRARATVRMLATGDVLIAGGVNASGTALNSAYIFDVSEGDGSNATFGDIVAVGSLATARHSVDSALLPDGKLLIPGGKNSSNTALSTVEIYDPIAQTFSAGASMGSARAEHSVISAFDGRVIVAGGVGLSTVAAYDQDTNSWSNLASMGASRAGHVGLLMGDGQMLFAGGATDVGQLFDPAGNAYDVLNGSMVEGRRDAQTVILSTGRAVIIGGQDLSGNPIAGIEIFTPDGGFNFFPSAEVVTPDAPQSWAFGALLGYRLIDTDGDNASRVIFQYSIASGPWLVCTPKDATIANDVNEGVVNMTAASADSEKPIDYVLKNTTGDHLFIWDIAADIAQTDYPFVKVRCVPFGADRGTIAGTNNWRIIRNSRILPAFNPFAGNVSGNVTIKYHLRDLDENNARVVFEYGRDTDGDKQILTTSGEEWMTCTAVVGQGDGIGGVAADNDAARTLATYEFAPGAVDSNAGWHDFVWDSVADLGFPGPTETWTDIIVRVTPYDWPDGDASETQGRIETISNDQGLAIELDPTAMKLVSWSTEGGTTYSGTTIGNVKLDESLEFKFDRAVDPTSPSLDSLKVMVDGRQILGGYDIDPGDNTVVRFFPKVNGFANGGQEFDGTEDPTVLTRGVTADILIPRYDGGGDPWNAPVIRADGANANTPGVDVVLGTTVDAMNAVTTSTAVGGAAYFPRGTAPTLTAITPTHMSTGNGNTATITVTFDFPIIGSSVDFSTAAVVVDVNANGVVDANDSVIPGDFSISNSASATPTATVTFNIMNGFVFPADARILVAFDGVTAPDGTAAALTLQYFTVASGGGAITSTFVEDFSNDTNKDDANTSALWNDAAFPGILTGLRDGGDGSDGTPSSSAGNFTFTGSSYDWVTLTVHEDATFRFTNSNPVTVRVAGSIEIRGIVDVSGQDGTDGLGDYNSSGTGYSGTKLRAGGSGVAGGGDGGDSDNGGSTYSASNGDNGQSGAGNTGGGQGGQRRSSTSWSSGSGGGAGGGHAQKGEDGGSYGPTSSYGRGGTGGAAAGSVSFSSGLTAGGGGGGGGANTYYTTSSRRYQGGGGGAGGGAIKFQCNGTFTLKGTGLIDASGGRGGAGCYYAGGGGGGAGGGVHIISGGDLTFHGRINVAGGEGGLKWYRTNYTSSSSSTYANVGGAGSAGRVRLEGPNISTTSVGFHAGVAQSTITTGDIDNGTGGSAFPSTTTTVNINSTYMNYSTMNIPAGVTVTLTGSIPAKLRFTGSVTINGTLRANGGNGTNGVNDSSSPYPNHTAATAGPGGGAGGVPNPNNQYSPVNAGDGALTGGGGGGKLGVGSTYRYYGGGGGGGANLMNSLAEAGRRSPSHRAWSTAKSGDGGDVGVGALDPADLTVANIEGGAGGGAGANAHWSSSWTNTGGGGGAGGGALTIETEGTFTMGATGKIELLGGNGGFGKDRYYSGGGGGGSGGSALIKAGRVTLSSGATIDTRGGQGGKGYNNTWTQWLNDGGVGGRGGVHFATVEGLSFFNTANIVGYSSTTGSLSTAYYASGDTGTTTWQTAGSLAPDFTSLNETGQGNYSITLEGAHSDPLTGLIDTSNTGSEDITANALSQGGGADDVDGYRFFRLVFKLRPPGDGPSSDLPEIDDAEVGYDDN